MIGRIWHGYTTPANADAYEALLKSKIFTGIRGRNIPGFQEIQLFRFDDHSQHYEVRERLKMAEQSTRPVRFVVIYKPGPGWQYGVDFCPYGVVSASSII